ncbi:HBR332Cp [Eremothecium sinecaudum]|uniref:2-dehydropantoate 2-reductase n=1 Tax=Eremothecium sinecaudum TaxID=45286 RepID=A0A109UX93_9SACH|nr:HBR332Cp [Eremothecium sinecaudum]AMD19233.1 HBR332Cp [Eremothecium sinecaudum]
MTAPIYVLGCGAIGSLLSVHLQRACPNTTIVPIFRSIKRLREFHERENIISVREAYKGYPKVTKQVFPIATCTDLLIDKLRDTGPIENLIIACKTYQTAEALAPFLPFLTPDSNIALFQNGLGVLEDLKAHNSDSTLKSNVFQGVMTHGVCQVEPGVYQHAGPGDCKFARLSWDNNCFIQSSDDIAHDVRNNTLVRSLLKTQDSLQMKFMTSQEMLLNQIQKFICNACINPVTAILDCINGELLHGSEALFSDIIEECLQVFNVVYRPLFNYEAKIKNQPNYPYLPVTDTLTVKNLLKSSIHIGCEINATNSSSMRQDCLNVRDTEVDYINGHITKLCEIHNLPVDYAKVNRTVTQLVKLRLNLNRARAATTHT